MSGGSNIRAIGQENAKQADSAASQESVEDSTETEASAAEAAELEEEAWEEVEDYDPPSESWIPAILAGTVVLGWTGFFVWTIQADFSASLSDLTLWRAWIIDWSIPVLLVGIAWLIARRNSRREALRFGETAALLAKESAELEERLTATNRELSMAREFLASQSLELESLGRVASERISTHAQELQNLIQDNGDQVDSISSTSETALRNMTKLRDDLPVIATSARDTTNQIGNAGRTAGEQLTALIAGFERLNDFGRASESQVTKLSQKIDATLAEFSQQLEAIEAMTAERFDALTAKSEEYRTELDGREVHALAAMRQRADDLRTELAEASGEIQARQEQSLETLSSRIEMLRVQATTLAKELQDTEAKAFNAMHQSKDRLHEAISGVFEAFETLDKKAKDATQSRVRDVSEEASRFDEKLAERNRLFMAEMTKRQDEFDTRETQASELLAQRLAALDEALTERRERQLAETEKLVAQSQEVTSQLDQLNSIYESVANQGDATRSLLSAGLAEFDTQLAGSRAQLTETGKTVETLTESGIRLLEIIQSGARQSREDLSDAIEAADGKLSPIEDRVSQLGSSIAQTGDSGRSLIADITAAQGQIEQADAAIEALRSNLAENGDEALAKLNAMKGTLARLTEDTHSLSDDAQDTLSVAISALEQATQSAFASIEQGVRERLDETAADMGVNAVTALERALRNEGAEAIGRLEQSAAHSSGVAREAATQLRDQLAKVNELTGNLEQRVSRARELAEEQTNNDFSRRMALITDSLNSASIDITSALASEVSDTAWNAYLKGDRGIFTRRAVRLLDTGQLREIALLYKNDDGFKDTVNRYIHDFEAMLRSLLSTRDGNALSVIVLGSDIGKLYVILAQSVERFRA